MCLKRVFNQFDVDSNGTLEKNEAKNFIAAILLDLPQNKLKFEHRAFGQQFESWFRQTDKDNSGSIDFTELYDFVLKAIGLDQNYKPSVPSSIVNMSSIESLKAAK